MGKLEKFLALPTPVKVGDGTLELVPLNLEDMDLFLKLGSKDEDKVNEALKNIVLKVLEKSFPDEKADIKNISVQYIADLIEGIMKIHGFEITEEMKDKALKNLQLGSQKE